jgi:hypothetical protein
MTDLYLIVASQVQPILALCEMFLLTTLFSIVLVVLYSNLIERK